MLKQALILKSSHFLAGILLVIYLGAVLVTWHLQLPGWLRGSLSLVVLWCLCQALWKQAWRVHPQSVMRLWRRNNGCWYLQYRKDSFVQKVGLLHWVYTPMLILLTFSSGQKQGSISVVIMRDALGEDVFRRLCVTLNVG